jgi:hypothetical protein
VTDDLLPCPFCGETGQRVIATDSREHPRHDGIEYRYSVICGCHAMGPSDSEGNAGDEGGPAITLWNRRVPYLPPEDIETLREIESQYLETWAERGRTKLRALIARLQGGDAK